MIITKRFAAAFLAAVLVSAAGCRTVPPRDTVTQVSTINALLAGAYDGQTTCGNLLTLGDVGLGTFHALDGEMIVLDGAVFQAKADGTVHAVPVDRTTPFAAVAAFHPEITFPVPSGTTLDRLEELVDGAAPQENLFCTIRVRGRFASVTTRSVPAQQKPYPPLAEVTKNQPVFQLGEVSGTLVGFRLPTFVKGINVPGYHLHFLSDDRQKGGHVLAFTLEEGTAELDLCNRFTMILPRGGSTLDSLDLSRDRSKELEQVERGKAR